MTGQRKALIVASDEYEHEGLGHLPGPAADAEALGRVLGDPQIGNFAVQLVYNEPSAAIQEKIEDFLSEGGLEDDLLLHFSCHGLKSESGELFLAARNTRPNRLSSTAIPAHFVDQCMRTSRSRRIVLLLDCCYGGAFSPGVTVRATGNVNVLDAFAGGKLGGGRGRAVITASSAMEYAFEGNRLADDHSPTPSVFTKALVDGLATGDADRDEDGWVALNELYDYVFDKVREQNPHQTPSRNVEMQGELYVARSRRRRIVAAPLPPDLDAARKDHSMFARRGAVSELRSRLLSEDLAVALGAWEALAVLANDNELVANDARAAMREAEVHPSETELRFGPLARGSPPPRRMVRLLGPPIARACRPEASHWWIHVEETAEGFDISVGTAEAGALRGRFNIKGPTGEAAVTIEADIVPAPPETPTSQPVSDETPASTLAPPRVPETPPATPPAPRDEAMQRAADLRSELDKQVAAEDWAQVLAVIKKLTELDPGATAWPGYNYLATRARLQLAAHPAAMRIDLTEPVHAVAWHPDGRRIALAGDIPRVPVYDISGEQPTEQLALKCARGTKVADVAFSPDGTRLAIAAQLASGTKTENPTKGRRALMSPSRRETTTTTETHMAQIWDAVTGQQLLEIRHKNRVKVVAFSPDGTKLATSGLGSYWVWDAATGEELFEIRHKGWAAVAFSPDGTKLATSGWDGTARVWDASTEEQLLEVSHDDAGKASLHGVRVVHGGDPMPAPAGVAVAGSRDDTQVNAVAFSPDGTKLATGSGSGGGRFRGANEDEDESARVWDATSGQMLLKVRHDDAVEAVAFSPDGTWLATVSGAIARVWDVASGQMLLKVRHDVGVEAVAFSPDGTRLATGGWDHTARIWPIAKL